MFISRKHVSFFTVIVITLICSILIISFNIYELQKLINYQCDRDKSHVSSSSKSFSHPAALSDSDSQSPVAWITSKKNNDIFQRLKHVVNAFRVFYCKIVNFDLSENVKENLWDILWTHNYPFHSLKSYFQSLKYVHCINHFPGTSFITNKVYLAKSGLSHIPKAFHMPQEKEELLKFAKERPDLMFVQKSNNHRGIKIEKIDKLDFKTEETFIQQFIHNPLLIDGYKFDIGVYTLITSISPLRIYTAEEVLFRFCPEKYYPFSANISKKYVVDDDYRPIWKVPSLKQFYTSQGFGMKDSFDAWLRMQKKDPQKIWDLVKSSIGNVFTSKEQVISQYVRSYPKNLRFFELMRFDFIIDADMNVYLMEANMSPNLNSVHFKENRLLYEQVVFNLLSLVGVSYKYCTENNSTLEEKEMKVAFKDIAVFPEHCSISCIEEETCSETACQLCKPCVTLATEEILKKAFLEHTWRGFFRRIIPKPIRKEEANIPTVSTNMSAENTLMAEWYRGKCLLDSSFCS